MNPDLFNRLQIPDRLISEAADAIIHLIYGGSILPRSPEARTRIVEILNQYDDGRAEQLRFLTEEMINLKNVSVTSIRIDLPKEK